MFYENKNAIPLYLPNIRIFCYFSTCFAEQEHSAGLLDRLV